MNIVNIILLVVFIGLAGFIIYKMPSAIKWLFGFTAAYIGFIAYIYYQKYG